MNETIRLQLLRPQDAGEVFQLIDSSRSHLSQWLEWVDACKSITDSSKFIQRSIDSYSKGEAISFGIWIHSSIVGIISFRSFDWENRVGEIGYWLGHTFVGRGIVTEACKELIALGFSQLKLDSIVINCQTANVKSCAVPKRLNFGASKQFCKTVNNVKTDYVEYSIHNSDWQTLKPEQYVSDVKIDNIDYSNFPLAALKNTNKPFIHIFNRLRAKNFAFSALGFGILACTLVGAISLANKSRPRLT